MTSVRDLAAYFLPGCNTTTRFAPKAGRSIRPRIAPAAFRAASPMAQTIYFRVAFKPVATVMREQQTVDIGFQEHHAQGAGAARSLRAAARRADRRGHDRAGSGRPRPAPQSAVRIELKTAVEQRSNKETKLLGRRWRPGIHVRVPLLPGDNLSSAQYLHLCDFVSLLFIPSAGFGVNVTRAIRSPSPSPRRRRPRRARRPCRAPSRSWGRD